MSRDDIITVSKEIQGGVPVFKGTRVPVRTLIDYLEGGDSVDDFLLDFPSVTKNQAVNVLELAKNALRINEAAA